MSATERVVLDSWPMVEAAKGSRHAGSALDSLLASQMPIISLVNCAEVYCAVLLGQGLKAAREVVGFLRTNIELDVPDQERVLQAGHLKASFYIALGDAFAVATAMHHDAELWTGDSELLFDGSPWRARDLRPGDSSSRTLSSKEISGKVGRRSSSAGRPVDEPEISIGALMAFLDLGEPQP